MLNERAKEILAYIQSYRRTRGSAPTIREIGEHFQISSTNGVRYYLNLLEKAGYIRRNRKISRGIGPMAEARSSGIPILGRVAAGSPILAEENVSGTLDMGDLFGASNELFALRVRGDSMVNAGIFEDDFVIVRRQETARAGEIIVALIEDEATVKRYQPRRGRVELVAENPRYEPIVVKEESNFRVLGAVRGVVRSVQ